MVLDSHKQPALENTLLGHYAGAEVTDGAYNTFVGSSAGHSATTPSDTTGRGFYVAIGGSVYRITQQASGNTSTR